MADCMMITAVFTVIYMGEIRHQTRIIHDTSEAKVCAMEGFVRIVSIQTEPSVTYYDVTSDGRFSCE